MPTLCAVFALRIPKSSNPERIAQNFDVLDWELPDDAMDQLAALESDFRCVQTRLAASLGDSPGLCWSFWPGLSSLSLRRLWPSGSGCHLRCVLRGCAWRVLLAWVLIAACAVFFCEHRG